MPLQNSAFYKYAFAQSGDKTAIPMEQDPQGNVSYLMGFTPDYSKNPEEDGKYILRDNFNQLLFDITNKIRTQQINGANVWSAEIAANGGYPAGAMVLVKMQVNGVFDGGADWVNNLNYYTPAVSLKDANTDEPTAENLAKTWWLIDGMPLFGTIIKLANAGISATSPTGYLEIGSNAPAIKYNFAHYPRVQRALTSGYGSEYFRNNGDNTFSITDLRGRFPRLWSNGGTIDSGRAFNSLQNDAIRNATGTFQNDNIDGNYNGMPGVDIVSGVFSGNRNKQINFDFSYNRRAIGAVNFSLQGGGMPIANEIRPYNFNMRMFIKI